MAAAQAMTSLQVHINRLKNFLNFTNAFLKKRNPIKLFVTEFTAYIKDLCTVKMKLKKIKFRINYEKYKLKKTELILAQNSEHVFLKGRQLNQTR